MLGDIMTRESRWNEKMRKSRNKAIVWAIIAFIATMFTLGLLFSHVLDIVADKLHNEEMIDMDRTIWDLADGEPVKVVTILTDTSQITIWVRKDSLQVDEFRFK
jgi:hypothetical protein